MAKFKCGALSDIQVTSSYVELLDVPDGYISYINDVIDGDTKTLKCSAPHYKDESIEIVSSGLKVSCGLSSNWYLQSELTIDEYSEGDWAYEYGGSWYVTNCSDFEYAFSNIAVSVVSPGSNPTPTYPTPIEIVESFGAGFFVVLPILLTIFSGRMILKSIYDSKG